MYACSTISILCDLISLDSFLGASSSSLTSVGLPSLKPNEKSGSCQRYSGSICSGYISPGDLVFISDGLTQDYIERKLQASLQIITNSPDLADGCAKFAIPAICLSTLPLCDKQTKKPRKVGLFYFSISQSKGFCALNTIFSSS